jgi:hypothetical protein
MRSKSAIYLLPRAIAISRRLYNAWSLRSSKNQASYFMLDYSIHRQGSVLLVQRLFNLLLSPSFPFNSLVDD